MQIFLIIILSLLNSPKILSDCSVIFGLIDFVPDEIFLVLFDPLADSTTICGILVITVVGMFSS